MAAITTKVFYINEISTPKAKAQEAAQKLGALLNCAVDLLYNEGKEAIAKQLKNEIESVHDQGYGRVAIFAHGQGVDIVHELFSGKAPTLPHEVTLFIGVIGGMTLTPWVDDLCGQLACRNGLIAKGARAWIGQSGIFEVLSTEEETAVCTGHSIDEYLNNPVVQEQIQGAIDFSSNNKDLRLVCISEPLKKELFVSVRDLTYEEFCAASAVESEADLESPTEEYLKRFDSGDDSFFCFPSDEF